MARKSQAEIDALDPFGTKEAVRVGRLLLDRVKRALPNVTDKELSADHHLVALWFRIHTALSSAQGQHVDQLTKVQKTSPKP